MGNKQGTCFNDKMVAEFSTTSGLSELQVSSCFSIYFKTKIYLKVREHCKDWLSQHPNGKMKKKCFQKMMSQALPDFTTEEAEKMENHLFRIYDPHEKGFIDFHEFMTVFMVLTGDEPKSVLEKMFLIFDVKSTGTITNEEMCTLVTDMDKLVQDNVDNETAEELAKHAFEEMDKDRDGHVTRDEFVEAVLAREKFSTYLALKILNIFG